MNLENLSKYGNKKQFVDDIRTKTFETEIKCHGCAQVIVQTFLDILEEDNQAVSMAASPFAAGLALTGHNCGAAIGGLMVLGLVYGRRDVNEGMQGILKGIRPMRKFVKFFESKYAHLNCRDLTGTDLAVPQKAADYFEAGGLEQCAAMMADAAAFVAELIYDDNTQP
jgi:C_GCAxxG_C_C family probable redox protein